MRPLKVGFAIPLINGTMAGQDPKWSDVLAMAKLAEDVGFDSLWFTDHLLFRLPGREDDPVGMWEGWTMLAAVAAVTSRVELGPFVSCASFRNPLVTAKQAVTVDEISGGRLILALGAGWHEPEYLAAGLPFDHRASRFEEAFKIISTLLREGAIDFEGTYHSARNCELIPQGPRPGRIPLMIGSKGPRVLKAALPHVDMWNGDWTSRPTAIPPMREHVDAICAEIGRDPKALLRTCGVQVDLPEKNPKINGRASVTGAVEPTTKPDPPYAGTHEELAELLRAYAREGISHIQLWSDPSNLAGIEAFGRVLEILDRD